MFGETAGRHPEDRPDAADEAGPWLPIAGLTVLTWTALVALDWGLLAPGTLLWATVRSAATLVFAPLAGAAVVQDSRVLGLAGAEFGAWRWLYGGAALVAPPVAVVYLVHRRRLLARTGATLPE